MLYNDEKFKVVLSWRLLALRAERGAEDTLCDKTKTGEGFQRWLPHVQHIHIINQFFTILFSFCRPI
jgi:hypothetical protein